MAEINPTPTSPGSTSRANTSVPDVRVHRVPDYQRPTGGPFGPGKKKKKKAFPGGPLDRHPHAAASTRQPRGPNSSPTSGRGAEAPLARPKAGASVGKKDWRDRPAERRPGSKSLQGKPARRVAAGTGWADAAEWYDQLVGEEGSEYHREVVIPGTLRLLGNVAGRRVLDVACGQGVLSRALYAAGATVVAVDASGPLIDIARRRNADLAASAVLPPDYRVGDATKLSCVPETDFDLAVCMLAIQDLHPHGPVFEQVAHRLRAAWPDTFPGQGTDAGLTDGKPQASGGCHGGVGRFVVVMMHPAFRSPKATRWGWDRVEGVQFRRVDRYLSTRKEPIVTNPGLKTGHHTWSFHRPLGDYVSAARKAGLLIDALEEWPSHKVSDSGPRAAAENLARKEIPMFLALRCVKPGHLVGSAGPALPRDATAEAEAGTSCVSWQI